MSARRPVRGILFDKDGTLIDCDATWGPIIHHLAAEFGPTGDPGALAEAAGLDPVTGRLRAGSAWAAGSTHDLVRLWWPGIPADELRRIARQIDAACAAMSPHTSVPLVDLDDLFDTLAARGYVLGIATNDSEASLTAFIEARGLSARIRHLIGYDSVAAPKPAADMVHAFCVLAGLQPAEVAVVGDNIHDLEMARAAGAGWAIGVLSGNSDVEHLGPHADVVLDSVADLAEWLDERTRAA